VRFLVDNALSPRVARALREAGHDAVHVGERDLHAAADAELVNLATIEDRIIISADTDFGTILALRRVAKPSFILLRGGIERNPPRQALALLSSLPALAEYLEKGAVAVITKDRIRLRQLPIAGSQ
jgi:predicted nuclease of predicted toxin-antitoxin system